VIADTAAEKGVHAVNVRAGQNFGGAQLREQVQQDKADGCTPIAVIASAGAVNTGATDPLREIAQLCQEERLWLHVNGAYGSFGLLDPEIARLFDGLKEPDSIAVDSHKWLALPIGCGATFVRDRELLGRTSRWNQQNISRDQHANSNRSARNSTTRVKRQGSALANR
jgi:glutamate/tyrosine decarboxylase-like PLP-dependent enzyme